MEMNFCRRCGARVVHKGGHKFECQTGHTIFATAAPGVGLLLLNDKNELLVVERAFNPGKGMLHIPGGFCDETETFETAVEREL